MLPYPPEQGLWLKDFRVLCSTSADRVHGFAARDDGAGGAGAVSLYLLNKFEVSDSSFDFLAPRPLRDTIASMSSELMPSPTPSQAARGMRAILGQLLNARPIDAGGRVE